MVDTKSFYRSLDLQKNEVKNIVIENLSTEPSNPESGQIYYNNSDNNLYLYNGSTFEVILSGVSTSNSITVDSTLSTTSVNPVQNQAVTNELNTKQDTITGTTDLTMNELTTNGNLKVKEDQDMSIILGRSRLDSRFTDSWNLSHYDLSGTSHFQVGGNTTTTFLNSPQFIRLMILANNIASITDAGIELESGNNYYLKNNSNLYHAIGINSTPGTVTSYYPRFQTATTTNSDIYSYSTPSASSNTGFKLLKAGKYKISYTINWVNQTYNNRVNYFTRIMKHSSAITPNETEISGTRSFAYSRDANFVKYATTTCTSVIDVSANEYIKIMTQVSKNDADFNDSFTGIAYLQDSTIVIEYFGDI